jgi:hypothetical protein
VDVYVERGDKKTFAVAVDWPGWARSGKDEHLALAALLAYGARYGSSLRLREPGFVAPRSVDDLKVTDRLNGGAGTDYGVPGLIPPADEKATDKVQLDRWVDLLRRAWKAFDEAADEAKGRELAPAGPRGGGRSLAKVRDHYLDAENAYLNAVGGKAPAGAGPGEVREAFIEAVYARARGELPDTGPRGGRRWPAAYAIRRSAWHALDHAWEIEDRAGP